MSYIIPILSATVMLIDRYIVGQSDFALAGPLALIAVGTQAAAGFMQYQGTRAQAKSEADIAEYNAAMAKNEAQASEAAARFESNQHHRRAAQIIGGQRATYGKSGVAFEGSPLLVIADTERQLNLESSVIRRNASVNKQRYTQQQGIFNMQASGAKSYGKYASAGSLLMGAGNMMSTGYDTGLFKPKV